MNASYIYFKEIDTDQDETYTADFSKKMKEKMSFSIKKTNMEYQAWILIQFYQNQKS